MDSRAIIQAKRRLRVAKEAFCQLETCDSDDDFMLKWTEFLSAIDDVFEKIEKGSRNSPQCRQWFGAIKRERKTDPLLNYLHHARNADRHGLEETASFQAGGIELSAKPGSAGFLLKEIRIDSSGNVIIDASDRDAVNLKFCAKTIKLKTVIDHRSQRYYQPPDTHFGEAINNPSPLEIGKRGLIYVEKLILEAEIRLGSS
ncbi:hypothetical protein [Blastochloris sulfoviridis]|uniref:Uncharacterized protein n=1 Tax=Blastochloris sulfoviridis TaxID=50712 RepID=A0A5M6HVY3_9HYPH|nr:hypothetical protein [Blastochloris sulfoviridis]KAA5599847.1 hypothetical protein F1193_11355 [Blastochloris sulfoviridis]